jgi:hypothetical protein
MMEGMMASLLGSLGIDPKVLLEQAKGIGEGFARIELSLGRIEAQQRAIMGHLGLEVPPMSAEELATAAAGTAHYIEQLAIQNRATPTAQAMLGHGS